MNTMNNGDTIHDLEISIEHARGLVARGHKVRELISNPAFKEIVDDGYLLQEAARMAHLVGDPSLSANVRDAVLRDLSGPGAFKRYIQTILQQAEMARLELEHAQLALSEELMADGGGDL